MSGVLAERQAHYWLRICGTRVATTSTPIPQDPWCRRILDDAAAETIPAGANGFLWTFPDGSQLAATAAFTVIIPNGSNGQ